MLNISLVTLKGNIRISLIKLYINRTAIGLNPSYYYWSSSEYDASSAWLQGFGLNSQTNAGKGLANGVRGVRTF